MKFRLFILLAPLLVALYHFSARHVRGFYVVQRCQHYPAIQHSTLYDFITQVHLANKWMKFVTFVATDHRPMGAGKTYKVVIEPHIFVLTVAEYQPGEYIALESADGGNLEGLKLRILLRFASAGFPGRDDHHKPPECRRQFTNRVSTKTFTTEAKFPSVANGTEGYSPGAAPGTTEVQQCNDECHPTDGSSLSVQIFFQHKSILFQNTIGSILRYTMERYLKHSLSNLGHILPHIERHRGISLC